MNIEQLKARRDAAKAEMERLMARSNETGAWQDTNAYLIAYGKFVALDELYVDVCIDKLFAKAQHHG